jgi:hypothetical protein
MSKLFTLYLHNVGCYLSSAKGTKDIIEILRDNHNWVKMQRGKGGGWGRGGEVRGKARGFTQLPRWKKPFWLSFGSWSPLIDIHGQEPPQLSQKPRGKWKVFSTDFCFQNLVFLEFIWIFSGTNHLKNQYLPHSESKSYQINSFKSCSSRSFQQHQRHIPIPPKNFSYDLI